MKKRDLLKALEKVPMDAIIMLALAEVCDRIPQNGCSSPTGYVIDAAEDEPTIFCLKDW